MKERLFPFYDYLACQSVRTILHCQSNIACGGKPLDVWLPITIAQRLRSLSCGQAERCDKQTRNDNSLSATIPRFGLIAFKGRKHIIEHELTGALRKTGIEAGAVKALTGEVGRDFAADLIGGAGLGFSAGVEGSEVRMGGAAGGAAAAAVGEGEETQEGPWTEQWAWVGSR
jgi:hypothetical protein